MSTPHARIEEIRKRVEMRRAKNIEWQAAMPSFVPCDSDTFQEDLLSFLDSRDALIREFIEWVSRQNAVDPHALWTDLIARARKGIE